MPLNFPTNPTLNQIYVYSGVTWTFNGNGWTKGSSGAGGGGGSGCAFGYLTGTTPTLSSWVNPTSVTVNGGNANSVCGVPTTSGASKGSSTSGSGYNGAVLIMW